MQKIEVILPEGAEVKIISGGNEKFLNAKSVIDEEGGISVSDSMKRTPNINDDEDAKSQDLEEAERQLVEQFALTDSPDEMELAGVVWRPAESIRKLIAQINKSFPDRSKLSDGVIGDENHKNHDSDHNPWIRDGNSWVVSAVDITNDPAHGCDAQKIVNNLVQSRDPRIKYIIWNKRIVSSSVNPWVWRRYRGKSPHNKHFHLSVEPEKSKYDSKSEWKI